MVDTEDGPTALGALLSAYAGGNARRQRLLWTLDARLARLAAATSEPMIGRIKLAWWSEALTDPAAIKGRGEPLIEAMRAEGIAPPLGLAEWLDGWEAMMDDVDLDAFAIGRGGGLFRSLASVEAAPDWLIQAGAVWALWDLSGHSADRDLVAEAVARAGRRLLREEPRWPAEWRPMRIAYALARHDIIRGKPGPARLTPRLYGRLLRLALIGR